MQKAWKPQIIPLLISSILSSSPIINPFPGPVNQESNRHDLDVHSSDVQHLPSGSDVPTGKESWAAETSSSSRDQGAQSTDYRQPEWSVLRPDLNTSFKGSPGPVLWTSCRSLVGQVHLCDRPFFPPRSAAGTAPKELRAGKLARRMKGEHLYLYLCQGWICHFLMELLAGGRVLYFISTAKHLV